MSENPIYCFNGAECCYNIEIQCTFYEGNKDNGKCKLEPMKGTKITVTKTQTSFSSFPRLEQGKLVNIEGVLQDDPIQRDIDTHYGPQTVTNFRLTDGQKEVRVTLWGEELGKGIMDFTAGNNIKLTNMSVREPYDGLDQINSTRPNPEKKFPGTEIIY